MSITMKDYRARFLLGYDPNHDQAWVNEREYSLKQFREYVDDNNPPIMSDLLKAMKRVTDFRYASLSDLLVIVNAKIYPLKVIEDPSKPPQSKYIRVEPYSDYLILVDLREELNTQVNNVHVSGTSTVSMKNNRIIIHLPNGINLNLDKALRTDQAPYNFMHYLLMHPDTNIGREKIKELDGCKSKTDMTEIIRSCGFDRLLKSIYFPGSAREKVFFHKDAEITAEQSEQIYDKLNRAKSETIGNQT